MPILLFGYNAGTMKKLMFMGAFLLALALTGAGCLGGNSGDWFLTFNLPGGWTMAAPATESSLAGVPGAEIARDFPEVVLQSTQDAIYLGSKEPSDSLNELFDTFVTEEYTYVRVLRLDESRLIDSDAEDIGGGFYRLQRCDGECTDETRHAYDYYFEDAAENKYQFIIFSDTDNVDGAIDIIRSAKPVRVR